MVMSYGDGDLPIMQVTRDYSIFKRMEGNRKVTADRAAKVRRSIEEVGYIPNPIIVNESMEVIDGQGRLEALTQLEQPVFYIVVPGLTLRHCISMNVNSTQWGILDYITSYANTGNANYERLLRLIESYDLTLSTVCCAATGVMSSSNTSLFKNGDLAFSEKDYRQVDVMLSYVGKFVPVMTERGISNKSAVCKALCFCYQLEDVDNDRMYDAFVRYCHLLRNSTRVEDVFDDLTDIYNYKRRSKVYIATKYDEFLSDKYAWYANYWGKMRQEREGR